MNGKGTRGLTSITGIHPQKDLFDKENRTEHYIGNSVSYSFRLVCRFFNLLQFL